MSRFIAPDSFPELGGDFIRFPDGWIWALSFIFSLTVKRSGKVEKSNFKTFKTQGLEWYFYYSNVKVANLSFILSPNFPGIRIQLKVEIAWSEFRMTL